MARAEVEHDPLADELPARPARRSSSVVIATVASIVVRPGSTAHRIRRDGW